MSAMKVIALSTGPVDEVTMQPLRGSSIQGGIRCGEMERDAILSYGTSRLLSERLLVSCDVKKFPICSACGTFSIVCRGEDPSIGSYCNNCMRSDTVASTMLPMATVNLTWLTAAMGTRCRFQFAKGDPPRIKIDSSP
jgi:DNA-directed RNA polymerase beta subunit